MCSPFNPFSFPLMMPIRRNNRMNSNPFLNKTFTFYNNNNNILDSEEEDDNEEDFSLFSLQNNNNFLTNYRNERRNEMDSQKKFLKTLNSTRQKLMELDNMKKVNQKKLSNLIEQNINEEKIEMQNQLSELKDIL